MYGFFKQALDIELCKFRRNRLLAVCLGMGVGWEIREINEIMNQCITGWNYFSNPRMFAEYGRQKGWEREIPATDTDNPPEKSMDGFVEVTEQMELPF